MPESDLPLLDALKPEQRRWEIRTGPDAPALSGEFSVIGHITDPNQRTAVVFGFVIIAGLFFWALDVFLSWATRLLTGQGG